MKYKFELCLSFGLCEDNTYTSAEYDSLRECVLAAKEITSLVKHLKEIKELWAYDHDLTVYELQKDSNKWLYLTSEDWLQYVKGDNK